MDEFREWVTLKSHLFATQFCPTIRKISSKTNLISVGETVDQYM